MSDIYRDIGVGPKYRHFQPYRCVHVVFGSRFPQQISLLLCIARSFGLVKIVVLLLCAMPRIATFGS